MLSVGWEKDKLNLNVVRVSLYFVPLNPRKTHAEGMDFSPRSGDTFPAQIEVDVFTVGNWRWLQQDL